MAKASNPPLDHFQSCSVPRVEGIDAPECLLDVLHAHGDVPPIQNAGDGLTDRGADKTGKCCFTIAKDRDGATWLPSLITKGLAQRRHRGFSAPGRESKPPRRLSRDLDLPHGDIEVSRLVAMGCPYVRPINQHHDLGCRIDDRFGTRLRYRLPFKISRDAMRSVAHGRVAHRITGQKRTQQPGRLAVRVPGAQFGL
jgi:hypothetical protein